MSRAVDRYIRITVSIITLPGDPFMNNQQNPLERSRDWGGEKFPITPGENKNEEDNLTATYWG
jgi:hypothetical protein